MNGHIFQKGALKTDASVLIFERIKAGGYIPEDRRLFMQK